MRFNDLMILLASTARKVPCADAVPILVYARVHAIALANTVQFKHVYCTNRGVARLRLAATKHCSGIRGERYHHGLSIADARDKVIVTIFELDPRAGCQFKFPGIFEAIVNVASTNHI
jgi:hypothetical protein